MVKGPKGTRRFGKKQYTLVRPPVHKTRRAAKAEATRIRKRGYSARVINKSVYVRRN